MTARREPSPPLYPMARSLLRTRLRQLVRRTGYDLSRHLPTVADLLRQRRIDVVFDVGANVGQYGSELRDWGYRGRIVSFEPLAAAYADLAQRAARDGAWVAHPFALGASETSADLHVSDLYGGALQQPHAQVFFKRGDHIADRRLRRPLFAGHR